MEIYDLYPREELSPVARLIAKPYDEVSVKAADVAKKIEEGWALQREGVRQSRIRKEKPLQRLFPDRVWTLMYRMGFSWLSGARGAKLVCGTRDETTNNQLDVVCVDEDVAIFIECRTAVVARRAPRYAEDIAHLDALKKCFGTAIRKKIGKRKVAAIYWGSGIKLGDADYIRSEQLSVKPFDERELQYYESLVKQVGAAAKYQFLADVFEKSEIPSLSIVVPAISINIGPTKCYSFSLTPEKLLKIAYVSHRAKGKETDVDTYQRLIKKSRIDDIREYVEEGNYFPTNIVLNVRARREMRFDPGAVPRNVNAESGTVGWLTLPSEYKSAWIIDGQHRLYGYSGSDMAAKAELSILAFEGLTNGEQAKLFVDINSNQKSVKRNLLVELFAELNWDSPDIGDRVSAVVAKLALFLDGDETSPFFNRIIKADNAATAQRSISLSQLTGALNQKEFFVEITAAGTIPGAYWTGDPKSTIRRAAAVTNAWFKGVIAYVQENWNLGKEKGGALGMNDSVVAIVGVLRSIVRSLMDRGVRVHDLTTDELIGRIQPYSDVLAEYFGHMGEEQLRQYRRGGRGSEGQTQRMRELQLAINEKIPTFLPPGLEEYKKSRDRGAVTKAREYLDEIELTLQNFILPALKSVFGEDEDGWWFGAIPKGIRERIFREINEEGKNVPKESKFTLIDYRNIALDNWDLFKDALTEPGLGGSAGKDKRTSWLSRINEIRKAVAHPSKRGIITPENLIFLEKTRQWLLDAVAEQPALVDA